MLSFHDFVLEYKENPKNKEFIHKVLKKNDDILIYAIMLFQKDIDIDKIISLQNYKSYIRQDIDLKYQELFIYDDVQQVMDKKKKVDKKYSLAKAAILHNQKLYGVSSWIDISSNRQK